MCAGRRRTGPHDNRAGIPVGSAERVGPSGGETEARCFVERIIKILRSVSGGFHDDDPPARGVENGGKIIRPPFDGNIATLVRSQLKIMPWSGPVHLQKQDIAGSQPRGCVIDRPG